MPIYKAIKAIFPDGTRRHEWVAGLLRPPIPAKLKQNQRELPPGGEQRLQDSLIRDFFTDRSYYPEPPEIYLATPVGQNDLRDHMFGRLESFRSSVIPWLSAAMPLQRMKVLEIGCGTGASTVALAEQGAEVFGLDVSDGALAVGRERLKLYGLHADFAAANAAEFPSVIGNRQFDCIIYFAVLEHMTWQERQASLSAAWRHLRPGQYLVVIETPNRLWYMDDHTSGELFFHWISDEAAFAYSRLTEREIYNRAFRGEITDEQRVLLARWGRGASFHDFVLAFDVEPEKLPVVSYLGEFRRQRLAKLRGVSKYEQVLRELAPNLHPAFLGSYLDVVFRKNGGRL
ncbi:MAG: methyltransferase domain-containing protein [Acidobacteriaceae bacterium]|nr:methyltransferase domain-containing protein [Acidobacteriaceae bacterium]